MENYFETRSRIAKGSKIYDTLETGTLVESDSVMPPRCPFCHRMKQNFEFDKVTIWCCPKENCITSLQNNNVLQWEKYPLNFLANLKKRNEFCSAVLADDPLQEDYIKKWKSLKEGKVKDIYLSGKLGSGKTYCLYASLREVCKMNIKQSVMILTENELFSGIKDTWDSKGAISERRFVDEVSSVDVLFLDDLGAALKTREGDWANQILLDIFDERLNSDSLRTIISSNMTIDELKDIYDARLCDRLRKMTQAFLSGESRRKDRSQTASQNQQEPT